MSLAGDLARAFDPGLWFADAGITNPDDWQLKALRSTRKRQLWNCHRQAGKSLCAGLKALDKAVNLSDAPVLVISPSQRQSQETIRTVLDLHRRVPGLPRIINEAGHRLEFENRSRIISLPSSEATIRGFSKVALLILDEASRIEDTIAAAARPMLAVSDGEIIALSTPQGRRGFFFDWWVNGGDIWERAEVSVDRCNRISAEFLDDEQKTLGQSLFEQEYFCRFIENSDQVFPTNVIAKAFTREVEPLWS